MNAHEMLIGVLARSETFQRYEHAYVEMTGMPLALRPAGAWQLPFHGLHHENPFCARIAERSHTCAACLRLQQTLTQDARHGPVTRSCVFGLCETAVPVKLGPETIGFLQTGQVLRKPPTAASYQRAVVEAAKLGVDIANEPMQRSYFETPVVPQRKLDAAASLLAIFADQLELISNQLVVQAANDDPPFIVRAKLFIRDHHAEDLSLRQVASHVNTSRFYFCKRFRKVTGLSFTQFVTRTRIEKAKNLLLNPNLRISEIAFAVGFQSLTHFNRMFKKIAGQSPSDDRDRLPAADRMSQAAPFA